MVSGMHQISGYLSGLLTIVMVLPYVRDILRGKTRPVRAAWFIWTVLGVIAFSSQYAKGATTSLLLPAGQTIAVFVVFLFSLRFGVGGFTRRDLGALVAAAVGLILWGITREPALALTFVILANSMGAALVLSKAYSNPFSETLSTWLISGVSGIFGFFAVRELTPALVAYPLYIMVTNLAIAGVIVFRRRRIVIRPDPPPDHRSPLVTTSPARWPPRTRCPPSPRRT